VWSSAFLGLRSQEDLNRFNQRAGQRYAQYNEALATWLTQRNEKPLMIALADNVSPNHGFDEMLEVFVNFNANMKATQGVLGEVRSKYEVGA